MPTEPNPVEAQRANFKAEYETLVPLANRFRDELVNQLSALVEEQKIALALPIESTSEDLGVDILKLDRVPLSLKSIGKLRDLVGIRLIFLFRRDAERFSELLPKVFNVLKQEDTFARLRADQFGYSSKHFQVTFPKEWLSVPSLAAIGDLTAELQVRTLPQHVWAAASQVLQYKNEKSVPSPLLRSIHRVSALLETVDLEFERVLAEREEYRATLSVAPREILNADSLEHVLTPLLPARNKEDPEDFSELLGELAGLGIKTSEALSALVKKHISQALIDDRNYARQVAQDDDRSDDERIRARQGFFFTHVGLVRGILQSEFGRDWQDRLKSDMQW